MLQRNTRTSPSGNLQHCATRIHAFDAESPLKMLQMAARTAANIKKGACLRSDSIDQFDDGLARQLIVLTAVERVVELRGA
jgi:hypothetical protein